MAAASEEYSDDYEEYYEDEEGEGPSGLLILVVGILIVLVFSLIVVFAYKRGMADGANRAGEVPLVTADAGPYKTERELDLPAGAPSEVEQRLSGDDQAEVLIDGAPEGDPLDDFDETTSASQPATSDDDAGPARATVPVRANRDMPETTQDPVTDTPAQTPAQSTAPAQTRTQPATQQATQPATQPAATSTGGSATSGSHVVQLGAVGSDAEAQRLFDKLSGDYPTLVGGKQLDVQRADLGSRGVFYRLRIGPFASSSEASSHCSQLKSAGQDCLVRSVD